MKYLLVLVMLLSVSAFAEDTNQCLKDAEKGYDKCMMRFGKLSDTNAAVCEDAYIFNSAKCAKNEIDAQKIQECKSVCSFALGRCMMHHGRYDSYAICEDSYQYCVNRCDGVVDSE